MTAPLSGYASEIYLQGMGGIKPAFTTDTSALEESARERMEPGPFWYVAGSAGSGATARANREALDRWRIVPRMLTDASVRDLSTTVLGTRMPAPVITAPIGVQSIVHPDGELATARATAELGVPMVLSTVSSYPLEDVAAANGDGARWFQLYWPNDEQVCLSILARAHAAEFSTLVVTLDTWLLG
ncbi:MAG: alpha-hydroxy-acid oxidizing protein, partial [Pseudonocardiales bacterium]